MQKTKKIEIFGKTVYIDNRIKECFGDISIVKVIESSAPNSLSNLVNLIGQEMITKKYSDSDTFAVGLFLAEAYANAVKHTNKNSVPVVYQITDGSVEITVQSNPIPGFDPAKIPDPRDESNINKKSGRGLLFMVSYMNEVTFSEDYSCVKGIRFRGTKD